MTTTITSIEKIDNEFDLGYWIKTTGDGGIRIKIDNSRKCCETYYAGVLHNKQNADRRLEEWIGRTITGIRVSEKLGRVYRHEEYDENDEFDSEEYDDKCDSAVDENGIENDVDARYKTVSVYTENEELPLVFYLYNCHNSFYPHTCCIQWKNMPFMSPGECNDRWSFMHFRL